MSENKTNILQNTKSISTELDRLTRDIAKWRKETFCYRWLNILLFWACKIVVPAGALLVAINMVSGLVSEGLIENKYAAIISIVVTVMASLEALLNPAQKKRLAFSLNNNLRALEISLNISSVEMSEEKFIEELKRANDHFCELLNHYSDNGY